MSMLSLSGFCQESLNVEKRIFNKDSIASFSVGNLDGKETNIILSPKKMLVIAFLSPECPLSKNYSVKLEDIQKKYSAEVDFIGIIPGSFDTADVAEFQNNYMSSWKLVRDTSLQLTHYLRGEVTPEVIVLSNKDGVLLYKGAIDDWMVSLGKSKNIVTKHYLDMAINNFLNNKPGIPFTKPVGCLINDI